MTIAESLIEWFSGCPVLADGVMHLDWLPADVREYAIDIIPAEETVQRYTSGMTKRQTQFYLASKAFNGFEDIRDALDNYTFYEDFTAWVEQQNAAGSLPDLGENRAARSVRIATSGYPAQVSEDGMIRYQIQLQLIYVQGGNTYGNR